MRGDEPQGEQPGAGEAPPERTSHQGPSAIVLLVAAAIMVAVGAFLAVKLREMSRLQDCAMSGRTNCAPISGTQR
jgi:hypothetical protein